MDDIPLVRPVDPSEQNRVLRGCTFIEDALNFRLTYHRVDSRSLKMYRLYHSRPVQWSINFIIIVLLLLIFFEAPSSLSASADIRTCQNRTAFEQCRIMVPPAILLTIEGVCLALLSIDCFIKIFSFGVRQIRSYPWHLAYAILLFGSFIGWFIAVVVPCCNTWPHCGNACKWRCMLRPIFLIQHSSIIKKALKCLTKALPSILSVLLLVFLHLLMFTLLGLALFPNEKGPVQFDPLQDEARRYFSTASTALVNMFILLTTSNNPNVMVAAYSDNRFYAIFFIIYAGVGIYCFLYILLAVVFQQFREYFKESLRHRVLRRRAGLVSAFHCLSDVDPTTSKRVIPARRLSEVITKLLVKKEIKEKLYRRFADQLRYLQRETTSELQPDISSANISWKIFFKRIFAIGISERRQKYIDRMQSDFRPMSPPHGPSFSTVEGSSDTSSTLDATSLIWRFVKVAINGIRFVLSHRLFIHFGSLINVLNVIFIIVQTSNDERKAAIEIPSFVFVAYYVVEQLGIVWAIGMRRYFRAWLHRVDLFFTLLVSISTGVYLVVDASTSPDALIARYATVGVTHILIGCRLGRAVLSLKMPYLIVRTMADLLFNLTPFIGLLMAQFYIYAVLGMLLFSDVIKYDPDMEGCWHWDNDSETCRAPNGSRYKFCPYGDDFHSSEFWAENFNDFASSVVVLWNLMIVNNWQVHLKAFANAAGEASQIFFIIWYILTVLISLDLFIAVIVENFTTRWNMYAEEKQHRKRQKEKQADAVTGRQPSARQLHVSMRSIEKSCRPRTHTQSQPMHLAYIFMGADAPNMELVRLHLASNPYYRATYAEDPEEFLAAYDTESEGEVADSSTDNEIRNAASTSH